MTLDKLLSDKGAILTMKVNYMRIPVYVIDNTQEGAHEFNIYYQEILKKNWNTIVRTKSHGISIAKANFNPPMWDVRYTNACIELTIVSKDMLRIQFRQSSSVAQDESEGKKIYGRQAIAALREELLKDGVNLDDYAVDNGVEIKKTIPKYLISLEGRLFEDITYTNCHHIDFHNSFPAGLVNKHPEFSKTINRLYEKRKTDPIYKAILNYSIGFMQSINGCGARWANLSRDAIKDNNERVLALAEELKKGNRAIISFNTDGIWYIGDIYHGPGEGKKLGEWENDHVNCQFRAKSAGAYEFIEDGVYTPVVRGRTNYGLIKPRSQWEWGDIYRKEAKPILFYWIEGEGLVDENDNLL